jgi:hypothetical protein
LLVAVQVAVLLMEITLLAVAVLAVIWQGQQLWVLALHTVLLLVLAVQQLVQT